MGSTRELYQSALRLYREDRLQEAISALEEALETDPQFSDAYEVLGLLYEKKGDIDRAISVTKKLAEADPDHVMAHTNLSRFYVRKGMIQEAEREQAEARRLSWKADLRGQR
jgi:tetratricopeptide (TPR) repeat protein